MQWAQLASSVLAEISAGALIFVAVFLIVWGAIAISSIKAAAKKPTGPRVAPLPLQQGRTNVRVPPPLPRAGTRGNVQPVARRTAPVQKPAKARVVQGSKPPLPPPVVPAAATISTPAQVRSAVTDWVNIKTLRSEFLLAEALKPPVALRNDPFTSR